MARQAEDPARRSLTAIHLLALDPGDRWVGLAGVRIHRATWTFEMAQLERQNDLLWPVVDVVSGWLPSLVALEKFQHRPQGHQAFNTGQTLQLIGALRYWTEGHNVGYQEIMAGNPETLKHYPIASILPAWSTVGNISHVRSAWRVLMETLQRYYPERMLDLYRYVERREIAFKRVTSSLPEYERTIDFNLKVAPAITMTIGRRRA